MEQTLSNTKTDMLEANMWLQQGPVIAEELLIRLQQNDWTLQKTSKLGDNEFLPAAPKSVMTELFQNFEFVPNWNPNILKCQILQKIDVATDISYKISKSGGPISSRDFKANPDGTHVLAAESVKHSLKPPNQPKLTRGTNGIGGWVLRAVSEEPFRTEFQWLLDGDLKLQGWIPKRIVDIALVGAALETVECLCRRLKFLSEDLSPPAIQGTEAHPCHISQV